MILYAYVNCHVLVSLRLSVAGRTATIDRVEFAVRLHLNYCDNKIYVLAVACNISNVSDEKFY